MDTNRPGSRSCSENHPFRRCVACIVRKIDGEWKQPVACWTYLDDEKKLLGFAVRWNLPPKAEGEKPDKDFSFASYCCNEAGETRWKLRHLSAPRPLYNLDKLATRPGASVIICEGEKAADAAGKIIPNSVCITSRGGSQAAAKADWTPLAGRGVMIWPDADEPGLKYAEQVATILCELDCEVSIIGAAALASLTPDGSGREPVKGYDAADAVKDWQDLGVKPLRDLLSLISRSHRPCPA